MGIHGNTTVPDRINEAWLWKQYCGIIKEMLSDSFEALQQESLELSKQYRSTTCIYAEKSAWYHQLIRTEKDIDMKQALSGWKLTVKKIGKGTGKNAPKLKEKARRLMSKCQEAVPAWIMPINSALENLNPAKNSFDVIIIDEASQSDISSLAILYMGKKLIIVGDDKQVSPMAVGVEVDKIEVIRKMYIEGKIPNDHIYDGKTSIYDIANTTFDSLMLKEHFRCVPAIIGFSNWLSYDYEIKPLRGDACEIQPAVVPYYVKDGEREGKINRREAETIVALLKACIKQPEYKDKTFGVISLLGSEQVKLLQSEIYKNIDAKEIKARRILCGNSANFQGDERDVVFLSMVDSPNENGPLSLQGFGVEDANRKRYNVAASRAKDQLWVVTSLDSANDLKPDDIRKRMIDYSLNPKSFVFEKEKIEKHSESPFEMAVAKCLALNGYHFVQQYEVGAYRLDMVVFYNNKSVAIECDGERWHGSEEQIRNDMERQTILERLGWRFIRIRGSEYFSDPEGTMKRVISRLNEMGIKPENVENTTPLNQNSELLQRVKRYAFDIMQNKNVDDSVDYETIAYALKTH